MPKVTVNCVPVALVTVPVAPLLKETVLFAAVVSKPKPLMSRVFASTLKLLELEVTTGDTVAICLAEPLLPPKEVTTAVRLPTAVGLVPKVTVRLVAVALVTVPVAPSFKVTVLFPGAELSKPVPVIVTVVAVIGLLVVASVTVGAATTVATCVALVLPLPTTVAVAFKVPSVRGPTSEQVSCVAVAAVTVAVPEESVTELFNSVVENPVPLMINCVAFCARLAVLAVIVRVLTVSVKVCVVLAPTESFRVMLTLFGVLAAAVGVPLMVIVLPAMPALKPVGRPVTLRPL